MTSLGAILVTIAEYHEICRGRTKLEADFLLQQLQAKFFFNNIWKIG